MEPDFGAVLPTHIFQAVTVIDVVVGGRGDFGHQARVVDEPFQGVQIGNVGIDNQGMTLFVD